MSAPHTPTNPPLDLELLLASIEIQEQLLAAAKAHLSQSQAPWQLVIVPEAGPARCEEFATSVALLERTRALWGAQEISQIFVFTGARHATVGAERWQYLNLPEGPAPLFTDPVADGANPLGYLHGPPAEPAAPAPPEEPAGLDPDDVADLIDVTPEADEDTDPDDDEET